MNFILDPQLRSIEDKVRSKERLTFEDGMILCKSKDLPGIGYLANIVRERKNGNFAYFVNNRHINYSNVCKNRCRFCAFSRDKGEEGGYTMSVDEVVERAAYVYDENVSEFHIVGGLHPDLPFDYYLNMLRELKRHYPHVHIQGFTAVELDHLQAISGLSLEATIHELVEAGLGSIPGGGAEIFNEETRKKICAEKISGDRWLEVMSAAHAMGLRSNATMLYGHLESEGDRIDHMIRLRCLQDETGGFMSFIPLAFHPGNTDLHGLSRTSGFQDLKILAISRLMLDNFHHIKAFWIMIGLKLAQISLFFGVDDIDGTVVEEKITHSAGAETGQYVRKSELVRLIKEAGREPVERGTLYNIIAGA